MHRKAMIGEFSELVVFASVASTPSPLSAETNSNTNQLTIPSSAVRVMARFAKGQIMEHYLGYVVLCPVIRSEL